ncbi:MAG: AAA domain-containing protein [Bacillota bacterium]|nr:AAA domain-containing protein [Bacillota bacterium]
MAKILCSQCGKTFRGERGLDWHLERIHGRAQAIATGSSPRQEVPIGDMAGQPTNLITEFIQALDEEIAAIKAGKGGSTTRVFDGRFVQQNAGIFVYSFTLENFIATIDDAPVEVQVGASRYQGQIIQTQGLEVIVGVEHDFGPSIPEARLITNLYFLHEALRKKFEAVRDGELSRDFSLAQRVFEGKTSDPRKLGDFPLLEPHPQKSPNDSQIDAIQASQARELTLVWGPPGTGKTETLARIVECFIKRGMRVLVAAHANAAVDEATEDIAAILKATDYYNQGKIIRLGNAQKQTLRDEYGLVLLDGIAERLGATLKREREELQGRRSDVDQKLTELGSALETVRERELLSRQAGELTNALVLSKQQVSEAGTRLAEEENRLGVLRAKLQRADSSGAVMRLFLRLDPVKIRREVDRTALQVDSLRRRLNECDSRHQDIKRQMGETTAHLASVEERLAALLGESGLSEIELRTRERELAEEKGELTARIAEIQSELEEIQRRVLTEAVVVCTTLTKAFTAKELLDTPFDVLVVDEASMAPMPHLYWALGRCRRAAVIVGDFLQLPPICVADEDMAQKWLGRSIYAQLGVPLDAIQAKQDSRVCLLDLQYRMHPDISGVSNNLFYGGLLQDHPVVRNHVIGMD